MIEDTDDLERIGHTHMLNVRGALSESEYNNSEWLAAEGMKLLESGTGIDTEYGKLYINEDVPFEKIFNGMTFPAYYCEPNSFAGVEIGYDNLTEFVELRARISRSKRRCADSARTIFWTARLKSIQAEIFPTSGGKRYVKSKRQRIFSA